jgi:hypothetical protein
MVCPHCHQNAPVVYKGVFAFCSACDKPRAPFSGKALAFAGQPSQVGGRVGRAIGLLLLVFGLMAAAASMLFFQLLVPEKNIGYAVGLPLALISVVVSSVLLVSSSRLRRLGSDVERQTRLEALYALAVNRGGTLTALDAGRALHIDAAQIEALLGELAKTQPEHVSLELDESGESFYLFSHAGTRPHPFGAKYRVSTEGRVRVADVLGVNGPAETLNGGPPAASRGKL